MSSRPSFASLPVLRAAHGALLVLWAGFWAWFVVAVSLGEKPAPPWWVPAAWLVGLGGLTAAGLLRPQVGGALLCAAGAFCAVYFRNPWAELMLAAPALLLGVGAVLIGRRLAAATSASAARGA